MRSLTHIVSWSRRLACEVLQPGDLAVDLTAGKGRDALALAQAVGTTGQVVAFDLQPSALAQAEAFLGENGWGAALFSEETPVSSRHSVLLVHACHSRLSEFVDQPCRVIMANLGFLPGGDRRQITLPATTLSALRQALGLLLPGGRLVVTAYPAHTGGAAESRVVADFFSGLAEEHWRVLHVAVFNSPEAPFLLVAERKK